MKTIGEISQFKQRGHHPLSINGVNVLDLSRQDPAAAHMLVANAVEQRGGHKAFQNFRARQSCIKEAMAKPLPGAAGDAFVKGAIPVAGKIVNRVVPTHFAVLQALDSPLLKMIENATTDSKASVDMDDEQQWQVCFVFTTDAKALRRTLKTSGVDEIKRQAEEACGDWGAAELNFVMLAVIEQLKRHVETTVKFAAEMEASGDVSFFREPSPSPSKPAASAG